MSTEAKVPASRRWIAVCMNSLTDIDGKPQVFASHAVFFKTQAKAMKYAKPFANCFVAKTIWKGASR